MRITGLKQDSQGQTYVAVSSPEDWDCSCDVASWHSVGIVLFTSTDGKTEVGIPLDVVNWHTKYPFDSDGGL